MTTPITLNKDDVNFATAFFSYGLITYKYGQDYYDLNEEFSQSYYAERKKADKLEGVDRFKKSGFNTGLFIQSVIALDGKFLSDLGTVISSSEVTAQENLKQHFSETHQLPQKEILQYMAQRYMADEKTWANNKEGFQRLRTSEQDNNVFAEIEQGHFSISASAPQLFDSIPVLNGISQVKICQALGKGYNKTLLHKFRHNLSPEQRTPVEKLIVAKDNIVDAFSSIFTTKKKPVLVAS